jgi:hypothetical protein
MALHPALFPRGEGRVKGSPINLLMLISSISISLRASITKLEMLPAVCDSYKRK